MKQILIDYEEYQRELADSKEVGYSTALSDIYYMIRCLLDGSPLTGFGAITQRMHGALIHDLITEYKKNHPNDLLSTLEQMVKDQCVYIYDDTALEEIAYKVELDDALRFTIKDVNPYEY